MEAIKPHFLPLFLGIFGLAFVIFGTYQIIAREQNKPTPLTFEEAEADNSTELIVDVEGAVVKPGVYTLAPNSRFVDALAEAEGLSEEADRLWVEKNVNMAAKLTDGLKIYIPRVGEEILIEGGQSSVLNINTASQSDLEALPGIGPVTAKKIIEARPFVAIEDLLAQKIIGSKVFEDIKNQIAAN